MKLIKRSSETDVPPLPPEPQLHIISLLHNCLLTVSFLQTICFHSNPSLLPAAPLFLYLQNL